jgi:hypothetical protein
VNETRLTVQHVVGCVRSVFVRRHELSKLDARLELRIQEVVLVKQQYKSRLFQQLVYAQRLPQKERIPLGLVSNHERCSLRDTRRTSRLTLRSSVNVWLNAETGAINTSMFTAPNKQNILFIGRSSRNISVLTVIKVRQPCRYQKLYIECACIDISPMSRPRTT